MLDGADPNAIVVFGSVVLIILGAIAGSIIKTWIKGRSGDLTQNEKFLAALREFKENTDRRLTRIEKVIDEISDEKTMKEHTQKTDTAARKKQSLIDIEIESQKDEAEIKGKERLKNLLDQ